MEKEEKREKKGLGWEGGGGMLPVGGEGIIQKNFQSLDFGCMWYTVSAIFDICNIFLPKIRFINVACTHKVYLLVHAQCNTFYIL